MVLFGATKDIYSTAYRDGPFRNLSAGLSRLMSPCVSVGFVVYDTFLKPGKYELEFSGSNSRNWNEILEITDDGENAASAEVQIIQDGIPIFYQTWVRSK